MTREEAIGYGKEQLEIFGGKHREFIEIAIKALDNLDKIRSEMDRQEKWLSQAGYTAYNVDIAFDTIKAVLAESEGITTCENCINANVCIMYEPKMKRCKDYKGSEV
jgi:methylthioribose-1-phosphate isomerase